MSIPPHDPASHAGVDSAPIDEPSEEALLADADRRARDYVAWVMDRDVLPGPAAVAELGRFDGPLPAGGEPACRRGAPATRTSTRQWSSWRD